MTYSTIAISESQKQKLFQLAEQSGYIIGKGGDSELPMFIDDLLASYEYRLGSSMTDLDKEENHTDLWDQYLDVLRSDTKRLEQKFEELGYNFKHVISEHGQVFIYLTEGDSNEQKNGQSSSITRQTHRESWEKRESQIGPPDYSAVGRFFVELIDQFGWRNFQFSSLEIANTVWNNLVVEIHNKIVVDRSGLDELMVGIRERNLRDYGIKISTPIPYISLEHWITSLHDQALGDQAHTPDAENRNRINDFVLSIAPNHGEALMLRAYRDEEDQNYDIAIDTYRKSEAILKEAIPETVWQESDAQRSASLYYGSSGERPWVRCRMAFALCLTLAGRNKEAFDLLIETINYMPCNSWHLYDYLSIAIVGLSLEDGDEHFSQMQEYCGQDGETRTMQVSIYYWYCRAFWIWSREGDSKRAKAVLKKAFDYNNHVPRVIYDFSEDYKMLTEYARSHFGYQPGNIAEALFFLDSSLRQLQMIDGLCDWVLKRAKATRSLDLL